MRFRPCIDLKDGRVVQIVGGTLTDQDSAAQSTTTNFSSNESAAQFAQRYARDGLRGGHVIALGTGNTSAATGALNAFPGGMQYGGGVTPENASQWLDAGASHVIVTSWLFSDGQLDWDRLRALEQCVGKQRLVIDLSCRRVRASQSGERQDPMTAEADRDNYVVVTDRWQTFTQFQIDADNLRRVSEHCAELLVHGVDVEGLKAGIEEPLVAQLAQFASCPITYAGGIRTMADIELIQAHGSGRIDFTVGSALDIFGGDLSYQQIAQQYC